MEICRFVFVAFLSSEFNVLGCCVNPVWNLNWYTSALEGNAVWNGWCMACLNFKGFVKFITVNFSLSNIYGYCSLPQRKFYGIKLSKTRTLYK